MNGLPREYLTRLGLGHFGESRTSKIPGKLGSVPLESRITKEGPKWQFDDMALRCNWLGACYLDAANRMRAIGAHVPVAGAAEALDAQRTMATVTVVACMGRLCRNMETGTADTTQLRQSMEMVEAGMVLSLRLVEQAAVAQIDRLAVV